jgi:hypothetical protein
MREKKSGTLSGTQEEEMRSCPFTQKQTQSGENDKSPPEVHGHEPQLFMHTCAFFCAI